jgi:hypothetical protein
MRTIQGILGLTLLAAVAAPSAAIAGPKVIDFQNLGSEALGSFIGGSERYYEGFLWQGDDPARFRLGERGSGDRFAYLSFFKDDASVVDELGVSLDWAPKASDPVLGGLTTFKFHSADFQFVPEVGMFASGSVRLTGFLGGQQVGNSVLYFPQNAANAPELASGRDAFFDDTYDGIRFDITYQGAPNSRNWAGQLRMDNLTITPVPEPSTYALMAAGLVLAAWGARWRSRA